MFRIVPTITGSLLVLLSASHTVSAFEQGDWLQQPENFKNSYQCINTDVKTGKQTFRYVIVDYPSGAAIPCSVNYEKTTENKPSQTLWRSANTKGYCEEKATGLANKLAGFGWDCRTTDNITPMAAQSSETPKNVTPPVTPWKIAKAQPEAKTRTGISADTGAMNALDFVGPVISLKQASDAPVKGRPYSLSAIVTDDVGVSKVHLFYQTGNSPYTSLFMEQEENSDRYIATLSEDETVKGSIKYYIMAEDSSGNTVLHGNSISPRALEFVADTKMTESSVPIAEEEIVTKTTSFVRDQTDVEQLLWQKAELGHNVADYQIYLEKYPFGRYVSLAEARLNFLNQRTGAPEVTRIRRAEPLW